MPCICSLSHLGSVGLGLLIMTYSEKLKDPRWQKKRLEVMQRDKFKCRDCGRTDLTLHVHHCAYATRNPWEAKDDVLLTLCECCHTMRQEKEDDARTAIGLIAAKMDPEDLHAFVRELVWATEYEHIAIVEGYTCDFSRRNGKYVIK